MLNNFHEFINMLPMVLIGAGIVISVLIEMYYKKSESVLPWFSAVLFLVTAFISITMVENRSIIFQGMLVTGGVVNIFYFIFTAGASIVCILSADYIKKYGANYGEYYILIQSSVLGMMVMAGAGDLFMIFLGLELMSIPFYVLAGVNRKRSTGNEASLKYFLLGAFATGFLVYGIALIYGGAHSTSIEIITTNFSTLSGNILFLVGILLFLIGFSFKIAAFPFHVWVPDVYEGSPSTVAGLFSTGGKAAAFSAIIATLTALFSGTPNEIFSPYLAVISVFSMLFGSIVALSQENIKRMLAYSSISHAGYILIGLTSGSSNGVAGVIFYLTVYTFMNLAAFGVVAIVEGENETNLEINSYIGLGSRKPFLAALLSIALFSLAGIPPLAGFFAKYYIFIAAVKSGFTWLAIIGALSSVISVYFYLRVVVVMYFRESEKIQEIPISKTGMFGVILSVVLIVLLGVLPGSLIDLISSFL